MNISLTLFLICIISFSKTLSGNVPSTSSVESSDTNHVSDNETLAQIKSIVQQVQQLADERGQPLMRDMAQKLLDELSQYGDSRLFFGNPCSFLQSLFRMFYCTVSSLDPTGRNPLIQGFLQFLNTNQMVFQFSQFFFCPFAAFGGSGTNGGAGNTPGGSSSAISCANTGSTSNAIADLDDPTGF